MSAMLKLITFDVTGTLLKLQPIPAIVYSQNAKDFGIDVSADAISSHFKLEWQKLSSKHPNYGCHSGIGWHAWWRLLVKNTLIKAQPALSIEDQRLDCLTQYLINEYRTAKWWSLTDGARDILDNLKVARVPIGVISNYDPRLESVLEAVGIRHYFKFVITSYAAGVMKPDQKIFKAAESQIAAAKPSDCLHVGNDVELDYRGAINAGWLAAIIDPSTKKSDAVDTTQKYVFASLNDLQNALELKQYVSL